MSAGWTAGRPSPAPARTSSGPRRLTVQPPLPAAARGGIRRCPHEQRGLRGPREGGVGPRRQLPPGEAPQLVAPGVRGSIDGAAVQPAGHLVGLRGRREAEPGVGRPGGSGRAEGPRVSWVRRGCLGSRQPPIPACRAHQVPGVAGALSGLGVPATPLEGQDHVPAPVAVEHGISGRDVDVEELGWAARLFHAHQVRQYVVACQQLGRAR